MGDNYLKKNNTLLVKLGKNTNDIYKMLSEQWAEHASMWVKQFPDGGEHRKFKDSANLQKLIQMQKKWIGKKWWMNDWKTGSIKQEQHTEGLILTKDLNMKSLPKWYWNTQWHIKMGKETSPDLSARLMEETYFWGGGG